MRKQREAKQKRRRKAGGDKTKQKWENRCWQNKTKKNMVR